MTFRMFVKDQVERLSQFKGFSTLAEPGRKEIIDWVAKQSGEVLDKRDKTASEWLSSGAPAKRVHALVEECLALDNLDDPGPIVRAVWLRNNKPANTKPIAKIDCQFCAGTGWEEFEYTAQEGIFAGETRTATKRCQCGGMPPTAKPDELWGTGNRDGGKPSSEVINHIVGKM